MNISSQPTAAESFGPNVDCLIDLFSGEFRYLNPSLRELLGISNIKTVADLEKLLHPDMQQLATKCLAALLQGSFRGALELELEAAKGNLWLHIVPFIAMVDGQTHIIASVSDITADKSNEDNLVKFANKKNSILQMLSHDLKGPLGIARNVLKSFNDEQSDANLSEKTTYLVDLINGSINLIDSLVMREFMETTDVILKKKPMDVVRLMKDYTEECKRSEAIAERTFQFSATSPSIWIELDNAKFMQVINNLISNALKFTKRGGLIRVQIVEFPSEVQISIADDGVGISESLMPELFKEYSAASRPGLRGELSTGIGLSIVKRILDWHRGSIKCESTVGKGTTFIVSLPKTK